MLQPMFSLMLLAALGAIASTVGLPAASWMMNRAVNSVDVISTKIDTLLFLVIGESAAASPENFDAAIGRRIARENARIRFGRLRAICCGRTHCRLLPYQGRRDKVLSN